MSLEHVALWDKCLNIIKDNVDEIAYEKWFVPIKSHSFEDNVLVLQVPSHFFQEHIEENYMELLRPVITRVYGQHIKLYYKVTVVENPTTTVNVSSPEKSIPVVRNMRQGRPVEPTNPFQAQEYDDLASQLNPYYTFNNYYSSDSNKVARVTGEAVAASPGNNPFNPMFIYGESGVGKTHLVQAIGAKIKEQNPRSRVLYLSANLFQQQYTTAVRNNQVNDFINFYQSIDVLLMDDIQEFAGKIQTQNTFFHIFNHLHLNGKQLVLTCDRPPVELEGIVPRLLTRFKWGLQTEVERPDYSLRRDILHNKIERDGLSISDDVVDYIARNVTDNVRDLEGTIVSLMAHAMAFNHDITIDLAEQVVARSVKMVKKQITIDTVRNAVCTYYNMKPETLVTRSRKREIVVARQVAMFLTKKHTSMALAGIGSLLGRYDHATVLHACKTIEGQMQVDKELQKSLNEIEKMLVA
ncbi:MAG: chromosomal replication initiator protein DnaA [Bacteroidaceae bacterium]|nr:chromosomal replication initiator protein DnaA [Bacteroidaceae bacterium]